MSHKSRRTVATLIGLGLLVATHASAQVNAESFARLGFNFSPPGARATGLGGAFIPLADDATAAESNPAGLTVLLNPQVSFEFKGIRYKRFLSADLGGARGTGTTFEDARGFPSFGAVVVPTSRGTFGLFRHELVNYKSTVFSAGSAKTGAFPFTSVLDLKVENVGAAVAVEGGAHISLGIAAGLSRMKLGVDFPRYGFSRLEPAFLQNRLGVDQAAFSYFVNAGLIWRPDDVISIGAVVKRRPSFSGIRYRLANALDNEIRTVVGTLKVPDTYGAGLSVRVTELFTVSADAVVNRYSQLAGQQTVVYQAEKIRAEDYRAEDAADQHLGLEYILFVGDVPISLRGGISRISASNVYYVGLDAVEQELWGNRPTGAQQQYSAGLGVVLFRRLQLETAAVFGSVRDEFVASFVYFLGER